MFIRKGRNKSGNVAIQIVKKIGRQNRIIKHLGTARTPLEIHQLTSLAQEHIDNQRVKSGVISLFDSRYEESNLNTILRRLTFVCALDTLVYRFLSHFYQTIGFSKLKDKIFKDLIIARITDPGSKRRTRDVLELKFGRKYSLTRIYRTLHLSFQKKYKEKIEQIVNDFVRYKLRENVTVLFFDVTTLYFEAFDEDDFRRYGFSKDNKHNQPQIVVALTVNISGIPLTLKMFEGDKFEGHTIIPSIEEVKDRFSLTDIIVVADAAMLSEDNLKELKARHIKYIVGARLGNISRKLFKKIITGLPKEDGASLRINLPDDKILLISYSVKRANKDKHDREKQIQKAKDMLIKPESAVKRYKFITLFSKGKYTLNEKLIEKAKQLEGIKGYITNAKELTDEKIIEKYSQLWQVEKSFRMSKSDLKARPVFHTLRQSVEAHLLIVFTALVVSRYIEMVAGKSIAKVVSILSHVKEIIIEDKVSRQRVSKYTNPTEEVKQLVKLAKIAWVT